MLPVFAVALAAGLGLQGRPGAAGFGVRRPAQSGWHLLAVRTAPRAHHPLPEGVSGEVPARHEVPPASAPARTSPLVSASLSSVRRLSIDGPWGRLAVERSPWPDVPAERRWRMVAPCCAPADTPLVEAALGALLKLPVRGPVQVTARPDDLERFGLLNPEARIELLLDPAPGGSTQLLIGARQPTAAGAEARRGTASQGTPTAALAGAPALEEETAGEWRFVKLAGSPAVYAAPAGGLDPLLLAMPGLWRRRQVSGLARHELKRLVVWMAGRPGPVTLQQEGSLWRLGPAGPEVPADAVERFVQGLWALEGHLVEARPEGLEALREQGAFGEVALEVIVAGYGARPPTRLVVEAAPLAADASPPSAPPVPPTEEGWGGQVEPWFTAGRSPLRRVYVEQGDERLLYAVSSGALRELEATAAQWTAPPPGDPFR